MTRRGLIMKYIFALLFSCFLGIQVEASQTNNVLVDPYLHPQKSLSEFSNLTPYFLQQKTCMKNLDEALEYEYQKDPEGFLQGCFFLSNIINQYNPSILKDRKNLGLIKEQTLKNLTLFSKKNNAKDPIKTIETISTIGSKINLPQAIKRATEQNFSAIANQSRTINSLKKMYKDENISTLRLLGAFFCQNKKTDISWLGSIHLINSLLNLFEYARETGNPLYQKKLKEALQKSFSNHNEKDFLKYYGRILELSNIFQFDSDFHKKLLQTPINKISRAIYSQQSPAILPDLSNTLHRNFGEDNSTPPTTFPIKHAPQIAKQEAQISQTESPILSTFWSRDGKKIAFSLNNNSGTIYETISGKKLFNFSGYFPKAGWNFDGSYAATIRAENICTIYRSKGQYQHPYFSIKTKKPIKQILWHPLQNILIILQEGSKNLHIWNINHKFRLMKIRNISPISEVHFSAQGNYITYLDKKNSSNFALWRTKDYSYLGKIESMTKHPIKKIFFSKDETILCFLPQDPKENIEFHQFKEENICFSQNTLIDTTKTQKRISDANMTVTHISLLEDDLAIICCSKTIAADNYKTSIVRISLVEDEIINLININSSQQKPKIEKLEVAGDANIDFLMYFLLPENPNKTIFTLLENEFEIHQINEIFSISPDNKTQITLLDADRTKTQIENIITQTAANPTEYVLYKAFKNSKMPFITIPKRTFLQKMLKPGGGKDKKAKDFYKKTLENFNKKFPKDTPIIPIKRISSSLNTNTK